MAGLEEKVEQYKAYLSKSFENPKEEKILYVFKKLDRLDITLDNLQATGIGKVVNSFRKHEGLVGDKARQLVAKWKQLVSSKAAPSSTSGEQESVSQPGLQCETVSETTYGSHSGRVAHRLDEVSKLPYMDAVIKTEPSVARVKEEPTEDKKSQSASSLSTERHRDKQRHESKEKSRKRERSPDEKVRKKQKHSHGDQVDEDSKFDLSTVKKERVVEGETKVKVKKEPRDVPRSHLTVKEEKPSPSTSPYRGAENCDSEPRKDKTRDGSGRSSSHKSSKDHHRSKSSDRSSKSSDVGSKSSDGSKDKHHKSRDKSSSSSNVIAPDKVKVKTEPLDTHRASSSHSGSSSHKVKVKTEKPDKSISPHPDFQNGVVKTEPVEDSSKKSRKTDDESRKIDDKSESRKHSSSKSTTSSSDKHSQDKVSSRSKEKHDSKKSDSKKHTDKKSKSSNSSSTSKSSSNTKKSKPAALEFDMFSMPNGMAEESDEEANDAKAAVPVKKEKNWSFAKKGVMAAPPAPSKSAPPRLSAKVPAGSMPLPRQPVSLSQDDILGALPEITPNYKPLPHIDLDNRRQDLKIFQPEDVGSKKNCRTLVYSGRRNLFLTSVPTLYNSCIQVLKDNVDALDYVGGVPYDIMKPVLEICTSSQLYNIEDTNPQFIGETDELWKEHCKKDFRIQKPEAFESWREMYIRCHDARDAKLKTLTASIAASAVKKKEPVRTTKLAYVDTAAKAPRDVARMQRMHGTAGPMSKQDPLMKLSSHRPAGQSLVRQPIPRRTDPNTSTSLGRNRQDKAVKLVAPMMRKTLRFMKSLKRK